MLVENPTDHVRESPGRKTLIRANKGIAISHVRRNRTQTIESTIQRTFDFGAQQSVAGLPLTRNRKADVSGLVSALLSTI